MEGRVIVRMMGLDMMSGLMPWHDGNMSIRHGLVIYWDRQVGISTFAPSRSLYPSKISSGR
jgi:hypothetical protein